MTKLEIIKHVAKKRGIDPEALRALLEKELAREDTTLLQHGDTLMYLKRIDDQRAHVYFVTADSYLNLLHALLYFIKIIRDHGIEAIYLETENPLVLQGLKSAKLKLEPSDLPKYSRMVRL